MTEKGDLRRHFLSSLPPPSLPPLFFFSRSILRIFCISSLLSVRHREGGCGRKGGLGEKQCEAIAMESNGGGVYNTSPLSPGVNKRWGRREGQSFPILLSGLLPFAVARWLVGWLVGWLAWVRKRGQLSITPAPYSFTHPLRRAIKTEGFLSTEKHHYQNEICYGT